MKSHEEILKRLKRKRQINSCDLDLVFFAYYLAGEFGHKLPVDFGRDALEIIIKKLYQPNK